MDIVLIKEREFAMGCDIHLAVERKENGQWKKQSHVDGYDERNYVLFGVLADVRNGTGFAGCKIHSPNPPIDYPRGLPENMDPSYGKYELGEHSFSWLTLKELQGYDWNQKMETFCVVPLSHFKKRVANYGESVPLEMDSYPYDSWHGAMYGETISAYRGLSYYAESNKKISVRDVWRCPIRLRVRHFHDYFMPMLATLGKPDDIRIVFGFDS